MHDGKKSQCCRYGCLYIIMYMSTCQPSAVVNNKDPVRVRVRVKFRLGLGLRLVWGLG